MAWSAGQGSGGISHIRGDVVCLTAELSAVLRLQAELQGAGRADLLRRLWPAGDDRLLPRAREQQLQPNLSILSIYRPEAVCTERRISACAVLHNAAAVRTPFVLVIYNPVAVRVGCPAGNTCSKVGKPARHGA